MFDGVVVIASFILDIVFIKGLTVYPLEETVQILAFLMPWRVIRVANSECITIIVKNIHNNWWEEEEDDDDENLKKKVILFVKVITNFNLNAHLFFMHNTQFKVYYDHRIILLRYWTLFWRFYVSTCIHVYTFIFW